MTRRAIDASGRDETCPVSTGRDETCPVSTGRDETCPVSTGRDETCPVSTGSKRAVCGFIRACTAQRSGASPSRHAAEPTPWGARGTLRLWLGRDYAQCWLKGPARAASLRVKQLYSSHSRARRCLSRRGARNGAAHHRRRGASPPPLPPAFPLRVPLPYSPSLCLSLSPSLSLCAGAPARNRSAPWPLCERR
jgi:hypothetical protein